MHNETHEPQRIIVSGMLDQMTHSRHTFVLRIGARRLRGILPSGHVRDYRDLLGEHVVVDGTTTFQPSGKMTVIVATAIHKAAEQDAVWEHVPHSTPRTLDELRPRNPLPPGASGFGRIFGQWPGDETDEEITAALKEMG